MIHSGPTCKLKKIEKGLSLQLIHKKFLGLSWLAYDIDFRRRAARDPTLSWNKIHPANAETARYPTPNTALAKINLNLFKKRKDER